MDHLVTHSRKQYVEGLNDNILCEGFKYKEVLRGPIENFIHGVVKIHLYWLQRIFLLSSFTWFPMIENIVP